MDGATNVWEHVSETTLPSPGEIENDIENGSCGFSGDHIDFTEPKLFICDNPYAMIVPKVN